MKNSFGLSIDLLNQKQRERQAKKCCAACAVCTCLPLPSFQEQYGEKKNVAVVCRARTTQTAYFMKNETAIEIVDIQDRYYCSHISLHHRFDTAAARENLANSNISEDQKKKTKCIQFVQRSPIHVVTQNYTTQSRAIGERIIAQVGMHANGLVQIIC